MAHYSKQTLNELAGGDEEFMLILAQTFLEEIPPDLEMLDQAIVNDNREMAYQFAHKMKPNLEMFGIDLLKDIASIEAWSKTSKNKSTVIPNLEKISSTLTHVFKEMKEDFNL